MKIDVKDYLLTMRTEVAGVDRKSPYDLGRYVGGMDGKPEQLVEFAAVLAEALKLSGQDHVDFAQGLDETLKTVAKSEVL